jgi:hypothetical protein
MGWWRRKREKEEAEEKRQVVHAAQLHGVSEHEVVDVVLDRDDDDAEDDEFLDEDEAHEAKRRRGHAGLWVTLVIVGVIFGLGVVGLEKIANGADQTGPVAGSGEEAMKQSMAPTPTALPSYHGQYISFSYPAVFDSVATLANWPTTVERFSIGSAADYRRSIQVDVEKNTSALTDDSGYQFRNEATSGYHAEATKVSGTPAVVMVKDDNTEQTLYWEHGGMLVVVSITSTNGSDNLSSFVSVIGGSLKWVAT